MAEYSWQDDAALGKEVMRQHGRLWKELSQAEKDRYDLLAKNYIAHSQWKNSWEIDQLLKQIAGVSEERRLKGASLDTAQQIKLSSYKFSGMDLEQIGTIYNSGDFSEKK
eukprot:5949371-Lingulodinium_polyedra.AAC.1